MKTTPISLPVILLSALGLVILTVLIAVAFFTPTHARQQSDTGKPVDDVEAVDNVEAASALSIAPDVEFTLQTFAEAGRFGFRGIGGEIDGVTNPDLIVQRGEVVRLILVNGDGMPHDFFLPNLGTKTEYVSSIGDRTEVVFEVVNLQPGTYVYYCTVPGHRQTGQEGKLIVSE